MAQEEYNVIAPQMYEMVENRFGSNGTFFILPGGDHSFIEILNPRIVTDEMVLVTEEAYRFKVAFENLIEELSNET